MGTGENPMERASLLDTGGSIEGIPVQGIQERDVGADDTHETAAQAVMTCPTSTPIG
jgi:hypothetical protein